MMARSTTRSNQRPDTLTRDRICRIEENLLQRTAGPYIWVRLGPQPMFAARLLTPRKPTGERTSLFDVKCQELTWCGSRLSPSFAQAFGISCHVFRPTQRGQILEIGDAQRWLNLTKALHHLSRPLHSPSERVGHGGPAQCQMKVRVLSQGLFGVRCRLVVAAGEHMSKSNSTIRPDKRRVDRAHAPKARKVLD